MKATSFKETDTMLGAGDNPNTLPIPVCHALEPQTGMPFVIHRLKLDEDEMKRIYEKGEIWVCVMGNTMPPILTTVYHPFKDHGFKTTR